MAGKLGVTRTTARILPFLEFQNLSFALLYTVTLTIISFLVSIIQSVYFRTVSIAMFHNTFQSGLLSVMYSLGSKPLQLWDKTVKNGHIKRITDDEIQSLVIEVVGTNVR